VLDALKRKLAYRHACKAVLHRAVPEWPERPQDRRVLVLLPEAEADLRAAWAFVKTLDLHPTHLIPVSLRDGVAYVPDAFAGAVFTVGTKQRDWRGLPQKVISDALWTQRPHVALDLSPGFDLAAAYLVGASPARFRVGFFSDEGEPFYDFMIAQTDGYASAVESLRTYLASVVPPVLAFAD